MLSNRIGTIVHKVLNLDAKVSVKLGGFDEEPKGTIY